MAITPLPRPVKYTERDKKTIQCGKVIREVWKKENYDWGDYVKMIQLLDYGKGEKFIRCGYYKKDIGTPDKEYRWGSQTTFISKIGTFRKLVKKAKKAGII